MAEATETKMDQALAEVAAEKAYADAAAQVEAQPEAAKPAKVKAAKVAPAPKMAAPAKKAVVAAKQKAAKPAAKKTATVTKTVATKKSAKPVAAKSAPKASPVSQIKDTIMTKTQNAAEDFTAKAKEAFTEAQDRAKTAYEKGSALFADAGEFSKGNIAALVESGKVLAAGLQSLGKDYVAEGKTAFETVQADVKELATVKSPADFFKLQGEILRRNFDAAVASGSKHSEMLVKLANDSFAPISTRVSVAIEKVKQAA